MVSSGSSRHAAFLSTLRSAAVSSLVPDAARCVAVTAMCPASVPVPRCSLCAQIRLLRKALPFGTILGDELFELGRRVRRGCRAKLGQTLEHGTAAGPFCKAHGNFLQDCPKDDRW